MSTTSTHSFPFKLPRFAEAIHTHNFDVRWLRIIMHFLTAELSSCTGAGRSTVVHTEVVGRAHAAQTARAWRCVTIPRANHSSHSHHRLQRSAECLALTTTTKMALQGNSRPFLAMMIVDVLG